MRQQRNVAPLLAALLLGPPSPTHAEEGAPTNPNGCLQAHLLQRHGLPALSGTSVQDSNHRYDKLTVEVLTCEPAATVALHLPERQQCDGQGGRCAGYTFRAAHDGSCVLQQSSSRELPGAAQVSAVDIVSTGWLTSCGVNNTRGDGDDLETTPKRSVAVLGLQAPPPGGRQASWQVFTILVQNPPRTPTGRDVLGDPANSFQLVVKSSNGTVIGSGAYRAKDIRIPWVCSYSAWVRTTSCTAECGGGFRYLVRKLLHPPPNNYSPELLVNCSEKTWKTEPCNELECDVDCRLSDWVGWADGPCTTSCGGGVEVQRRRVIAAPGGAGRPCAHWSHSSRVRYRPCGAEPCPLRCEAGGASSAATQQARFTSAGHCSEPCGSGLRAGLVPAVRKDRGMAEAACAYDKADRCNLGGCRAFNLFPSRPNQVPWVDRWFDLQVIFFISDLTTVLELTAPPGFLLGQGSCQLVEHNLPRLRGCKVAELNGSRQKAVFDFLNPLEPHRFERGDAKYRIRLWVKHPGDCPGGVDPWDVCHGSPGDRNWTLDVQSHLPETLRESITGSYEIYQLGASPRAHPKPAVPDGAKVALTALSGGAFRWSPHKGAGGRLGERTALEEDGTE